MNVTLDSNFGAGASFTLLGADLFGGFSITTGTGANPFGGAATFSFGADYVDTDLSVLISRLDSTTESITVQATGGVGGFVLNVEGNGGHPVADNTTYRWAYKVG
jgi:hypothetical protein